MESSSMPKHSNIKKWGISAILLYLLYVFCTGVFPFLRSGTVSEAFASSVSVSEYYSDTLCTDRVALVEAPADGFDTRIHILDAAQTRIDVSYYALHMGRTTDLFLGALLDAADRGVQVRVLVDGQFGGLTSAHRSYAFAIGAHPNIELKIYNPPNPLKPWTWNGRLHDKYIIIDDRLLLMGGRNIGDRYFAPDGWDKTLSYDRDVLIYNTAWEEAGGDSVLYVLRDYMDALWASPDVRKPYEQDTKSGAARRRTLQTEFQTFRGEHPELFDHAQDDYESLTCPANRVTFFHNDTNIGVKEPKTGYVLGELLRSAESSAVLQSPYVILDGALEQLLRDLGEKQIDAAVLTNSPASSPNPIASAAYLGDRKAIAKTGVRLLEYQGENAIHAKTYLIDDRMAVVGSYNLDPRSACIDTEMMLAIDSETFVRQLKQAQDTYLRQALEVAGDGDYLPREDLEERALPLAKRVLLWLLFLPARLFKQLT